MHKIKNIKEIKFLWKKYTLSENDVNTDFFDAGGDSLSAIHMIVDIKNAYGVQISLENFMKNPTIQYLITIIEKKHTGIK